MKQAKFLLRFDDICPTMNWKIWHQVEELLIDHDIRPILAIIPDNADEMLKVDSPDPTFWEQARGWQDRGWTIGLHGYQHRYVTNESGIIGLNRYSEFAGLPEHIQEEKIQKGIQILNERQIQPVVWVAPAHSFDAVTVRALSRAGIDTISDGFALRPYSDADGTRWIPQQMWRFREAPAGIWTICYHINSWTANDFARFHKGLLKYRDRIISLPEAARECGSRRRSTLDGAAEVAIRLGIWAVRKMRGGKRASRPAPAKNGPFRSILGSHEEHAD